MTGPVVSAHAIRIALGVRAIEANANSRYPSPFLMKNLEATLRATWITYTEADQVADGHVQFRVTGNARYGR